MIKVSEYLIRYNKVSKVTNNYNKVKIEFKNGFQRQRKMFKIMHANIFLRYINSKNNKQKLMST